MHNKPLIGVTPLWDSERSSVWMLPEYLDAIRGSGGIPVVLPLVAGREETRILAASFDGFLFAGGTVMVTNGSGGCGVGDNDDSNSTCGNVYFTGGTVTVTGGIYVNRTLGASRIYVDGVDIDTIILVSPYYYPAQN